MSGNVVEHRHVASRILLTHGTVKLPSIGSQKDIRRPLTHVVSLGESRQQAINAVANRWAEKDPQAALDWLERVQEIGTRNRASSRIRTGDRSIIPGSRHVRAGSSESTVPAPTRIASLIARI